MNIAWIVKALAAALTPKPKPAPKPVSQQIDWNDEYARLNYYQDSDFAAYQKALADRVPVDGIKPWIDPADYATPCPTPAQWATLTDAQKADKGSVRF